MSGSPALATAASLPPELVQLVVDFIGTTDWEWATDRNHLATASLVCIEWANSCRRRHFQVTPIRIRSLSDLQALDSFATNGSQRLVPLHSLVQTVHVQQNWDSRSWCHSLRTSVFYKMIASAGTPLEYNKLILKGPVPAHLPLPAYLSPTWDLPRTLPPYFFPFKYLVLNDIRFPSLSDILTLWRNLTHISSILCERLTWDNADVSFVVNRNRPLLLPNPQALRSDSSSISARGCVDNALIVALALLYRFSDSETPFLSMGSHQRDAYVAIFHACMFTGEGLSETERLLDVSINGSMSTRMSSDAFLEDIPGVITEPLVIMVSRSDADGSRRDGRPGREYAGIVCRWYCSPENGTGNAPAHTQHVIGLQIYLWTDAIGGRFSDDFKQALEVFRSNLAAFPHLRVAGVVADPETILQDITQASPALSQRPTGEAHQELYWKWGSELYAPQDTHVDVPQDSQV